MDEDSPFEKLANSIKAIDETLKQYRAVFTNRALMLFLRDTTKMKVKDIQRVLDAIPRLKERYLKG